MIVVAGGNVFIGGSWCRSRGALGRYAVLHLHVPVSFTRRVYRRCVYGVLVGKWSVGLSFVDSGGRKGGVRRVIRDDGCHFRVNLRLHGFIDVG